MGLVAISFPAWSSNLRTPEQAEGPFYPVKPIPLTKSLVSSATKLLGEPMDLSGEVRDTHGNPMPGIRIEFWQCDAQGLYDHPMQQNTESFDPAFMGSGAVMTDKSGNYDIAVLYPVPYPGRPPHIHVKLWKGKKHFLTTQLYLKGNSGSRWLSRDREFLLIDPQKVNGKFQANFVFVV
uniref:dioxygenase family protein n=1 Tax=Enterovibrio coralii TaxID=294935 RepID=UPI002FC3BF26